MSAAPESWTRRLLSTLALAERGGTEGERSAAIHAVGRLVLANAEPFRAMLNSAPAPRPSSFRRVIDQCLQKASDHDLTGWERRFLLDIRTCPHLSPKQRADLDWIAARLGVTGRA